MCIRVARPILLGGSDPGHYFGDFRAGFGGLLHPMS